MPKEASQIYCFRSRSAQSIIELLVGIALATVFIIGAAAVIAPSLQINKQTAQAQTRTELASELLDNVRVWAAGNWNSVLTLATGTANTYYLNTANSPFTISAGSQTVLVSSSTYTRYFYLSDVYRDLSGNITTTIVSYDPSTKLVTVAVQASSTTVSPVLMVVEYLTRNVNSVFNQTSWAGGSGQSVPVTVASTTYASGTSISISASGTITLAPVSGGSCVQ